MGSRPVTGVSIYSRKLVLDGDKAGVRGNPFPHFVLFKEALLY
jgi:hypothetical protein